MNPRRFATMTAVLCETALVACIVGLVSTETGTEDIGTAPTADRVLPYLAADVMRAVETDRAAPDKAAVESLAVANADTARLAKPVTTTETTAPPAEPEPVLRLASADPSQVLSQEAPPIGTAPASTPESVVGGAGPAVGSLEIVDECLVVDICIDRYLWELYQRTPKEDTIKVDEQRMVTVKRKKKMVTVTKTFTKLVDENFAWKDPKAAEKAGMPMVDYVIGGMDRDFKLRLFHALHAAEEAGLSPGITSAFRDDYRQSIASGLKAATDRSYHGGSFRGGYGHGLAADVVSVKGATRAQRQASSDILWSWIDAHGKEFGIGRPYLDRDPPHLAPIDGKEYLGHRGATASHAASDTKQRKHARADRGSAKRAAKASKVKTG
jgi:hypothetical protein